MKSKFNRKSLILAAAVSSLFNRCSIEGEAAPAVESGGTSPAPAVAAKAKPAKAAKAKPAKKTKAPAKAKKAAKPAKAKKAKKSDAEGPAVLREYAADYTKHEKKTAGGNVSIDCADATADKLRGKDLEDVYTLAAKATGDSVADLKKKYKHLNLGMQRMNLGNRIRAIANAK